MSDSDDILGEEETPSLDTGKKTSGFVALLPNLLKFVAIGVGAVIFIVTVSVITYTILNKSGQSQTVIPANSPFVGVRSQYSVFTSIGVVRTNTVDDIPYSVVVDMNVGYDLNDNATATELTGRLYELRDFVRSFFNKKKAAELKPEHEERIKREILEQLNSKVLNSGRARIILFQQFDVMAMQ